MDAGNVGWEGRYRMSHRRTEIRRGGKGRDEWVGGSGE